MSDCLQAHVLQLLGSWVGTIPVHVISSGLRFRSSSHIWLPYLPLERMGVKSREEMI